MDTKKALIIIMVLLILMNITLASYIIIISSERDKPGDIVLYAVEILNQRNIGLECIIPEDKAKPSSVVIGGNIFNSQSIDSIKEKTGGDAYFDFETDFLHYYSTNSENVIIGDITRTEVESKANEFITSIGLNRNDFVLDFYLETGNNIYTLKYIRIDGAGNYYFNSYVEMQITEKGVVSAIVIFGNISAVVQQNTEGLPVSTILLANLEADKDRRQVVISINAGFYKNSDNGDQAVMSWRIRFSDGNERFFDAGTGLEIN